MTTQPDITPQTLYGNIHALPWAQAFAAKFAPPRPDIDWVGTLIGWFANAIETGRIAGRDEARAKAEHQARARGRDGGILWCGHWSPHVTPGKAATSNRVSPHGGSRARCDVCCVERAIRETNVWEFDHRPFDGGPEAPSRRMCPDAGTCHHSCGEHACYRVRSGGPLTGVFIGDRWPDQVKARFDDRVDPSPDPLLGWSRQLRIVDPELVAQFEAAYEDPKFSVTAGVTWCDRCGAEVDKVDQHRLWHQELSLGVWALGSMLRARAEA